MLPKPLYRTLKLHGYSIHPDALSFLSNELQNEPSLIVHDVIAAFKASKASILSKAMIQEALLSLLSVSNENEYSPLITIDAFEVPAWEYQRHSKKYSAILQNSTLQSQSEWKCKMMQRRFASITERLLRNVLFCAPVLASDKTSFVQLSTIESLMGTVGMKRIVGMLGEDERKRLYLEDTTARICIDLSSADFNAGLFTVNTVVLVEGNVLDDILQVTSMGLPPPEKRSESMAILNDIDPWGLSVSTEQLEQIIELEENDTSAFVVFSDVHLDDAVVMTKLRLVFTRYANNPPALFLLIGNFTSNPIGLGSESYSMNDMKEYFDALADLILEFPTLVENSTFVLVPGTSDPGFGKVLPRPGLPKVCTARLVSTIPNLILASNPCRIRYFTKDIVIARNDFFKQFRQNSIVPVGSVVGERKVENCELVAKTIIDQGHLSPFPLSVQPVYWQHDAALTLFPLPHVLILADAHDPFQLSYAETAVFNPGSFAIDYSIALFHPSSLHTEFSNVDDHEYEPAP